jgi:hypothetical protein
MIYTQDIQYVLCVFLILFSLLKIEANGYRLVFETDYANRIAGTDATMFGRPVTSPKILIYVNDIYRTCFIEHKKDVRDWHQIKLRRYGLQTKDLYNTTLNPASAQYYNFGPSGLENITQAAGMNAWISMPHFYKASSILPASISGLNPNADDHETYLDIEPNTGLLARARKSLQLNYVLSNWYAPSVSDGVVENITDVCSAPGMNTTDCLSAQSLLTCLNIQSNWTVQNNEIYYPYAWAEEGFALSRDDAESLQDSLFSYIDLAQQVQLWSLVAAGILFAMLVVLIVKFKSSTDDSFSDVAWQDQDMKYDISGKIADPNSDLVRSLLHGNS